MAIIDDPAAASGDPIVSAANEAVELIRLDQATRYAADQAGIRSRRRLRRARAKHGRPAVSNTPGVRAFIPGVHVQRSVWARRTRDVYVELLGDKPDASVAEKVLLKRSAAMVATIEKIELRLATFKQRGDELSVDELDALLYLAGEHSCGSMRLARILLAVGLERRAKDLGDLLDPLQYGRRFSEVAAE